MISIKTSDLKGADSEVSLCLRLSLSSESHHSRGPFCVREEFQGYTTLTSTFRETCFGGLSVAQAKV